MIKSAFTASYLHPNSTGGPFLGPLSFSVNEILKIHGFPLVL